MDVLHTGRGPRPTRPGMHLLPASQRTPRICIWRFERSSDSIIPNEVVRSGHAPLKAHNEFFDYHIEGKCRAIRVVLPPTLPKLQKGTNPSALQLWPSWSGLRSQQISLVPWMTYYQQSRCNGGLAVGVPIVGIQALNPICIQWVSRCSYSTTTVSKRPVHLTVDG